MQWQPNYEEAGIPQSHGRLHFTLPTLSCSTSNTKMYSIRSYLFPNFSTLELGKRRLQDTATPSLVLRAFAFQQSTPAAQSRKQPEAACITVIFFQFQLRSSVSWWMQPFWSPGQTSSDSCMLAVCTEKCKLSGCVNAAPFHCGVRQYPQARMCEREGEALQISVSQYEVREDRNHLLPRARRCCCCSA